MSLNEWSAADVAAKFSGSGKSKAKKTGRGWMVCCPAHDDRTPSLSLADGREGVLLYHCFGGCPADDVRAALEGALGVHSAPEKPIRKRRVVKKEEELEVIMPVPEARMGVRPEDFDHFDHGMPSTIWTYRLPEGKIAGWVARYDLGDGDKETIPWAWTKDPKSGKEKMRMKGLPAPRPLYNLDQIEARLDDPILINEGEKAADAAQKLFPGWVSTAWQGGGNAIGLADLKPLHGRLVILLCDHDGPGYSTGARIVELLASKAKVYFLRWPTQRLNGDAYDLQEKDDAADHLERGWTADELRQVMQERGGLTLPVGEIAPAFDVIHYDRQSERRFQEG